MAGFPLLAIAALLAATVAGATPGMPGEPALLIDNVTILDLPADDRLTGRAVLIRDGRIAAIGRAPLTAPDDTLRIDATGHFLLPGLAEMHAHLPPAARGSAWRDRVLFLYLAAGVTTVRGMLGEPAHLEWRAQAHDHALLAPRIVTSGPSFSGGSVHSAAAARERARAQAAAGYDFLKLHPGLTRRQYDALAATADELGIPFAGHVALQVGLDRTLAAGQATIDHLDGYLQALVPAGTGYPASANGFFGVGLAPLADADRIAALAGATAAAGVWNVPTQTLIENVVLPGDPDALAAQPEMRYVPATLVDQWRAARNNFQASPGYDAAAARQFVELRRRLILALHNAGAGLLLGSDAPQVFNVPGYAAHRELAALVAAGLTPRAALLTGTANPARFFGATDRFGAVAVGLDADLLLLRADPTTAIGNIATIAAVVARGRWLPRATIDARLAELAQR